jgi:putative methionine-R-sulfoxide reductase with GAF domain
VPLFDADNGKVQAVLYLDASKRDFFNDARQELVLSAVNGIAVFIGKRYA